MKFREAFRCDKLSRSDSKTAELKKAVKRSSRRIGVNLQLFCVQPTSLGSERGEQPLSRGSSASKSLALFWFSFGGKREYIRRR